MNYYYLLYAKRVFGLVLSLLFEGLCDLPSCIFECKNFKTGIFNVVLFFSAKTNESFVSFSFQVLESLNR